MTENIKKNSAADLALCGGLPLFTEPRHVGRPQTPEPEALLAGIGEVFASGVLTNQGPRVKAFEDAVCAYLDVPFCVATCNGTLALLLMLKALDVRGEVIVPSFTFPATVQVLSWLGLTPVFAEVDPLTHCLDPQAVAASLSPRTGAILGVHLWGVPCAIDALHSLAERHGLPLLFDAAHAFGCSAGEQMIGNFGVAEMLSFHATKFVHCLEGGAVVTASAELARKLRQMRNFGYEQGEVRLAGLNAKMSEVSACVGLHNLAHVDATIAVNRRNYQLYCQGLSGIAGLRFYAFAADQRQNYQYVVLEVMPEFGLSRDQLLEVLTAEGVLARRYFDPPCHLQPPWNATAIRLPVTEALAARVLLLPTGSQLEPQDVQRICALIAFCRQQAEEISARTAPP